MKLGMRDVNCSLIVKLFKDRDVMVNSIVVVAEEFDNVERCPLAEENCIGYNVIELKEVLQEFSTVFDEIPGSCE